jgi:predicted HTH transcriptional regulator
MIPKPLQQVAKADIDALVDAKTSERRTLDYKEELPGNTDEQKKEFLYDISSFANAGGGDLIFGIKDQRDANGKPMGIPDAATGLKSVTNLSAEVSRLEGSLQSAIEPRIPGIQFKEIGGFSEGSILIVRVPKSWASPHMVTYKG